MSTGADPRARSTRVLARDPSEDFPFSISVISSLPWFSSHGLLLQYNSFHLPVKPPSSRTKDRKTERRSFLSNTNTCGEGGGGTRGVLLRSKSLFGPNQNAASHFTFSLRDIIIQHDFWTASCTIRNSAALGKKM